MILFYPSIYSQVTGDLKIAFIRVSFISGDYPGFTGNGDFNYIENNFCEEYTIDPPPHDFNYFNSHVHAVNNYFKNVSFGKFGIDTNNSQIFPSGSKSSYRINRPMNYYKELGKEEEHEYRISQLLNDGISAAFSVDSLDFSGFDLIAIIHAGLGQDFSLPFLDPTPEDIPSTFVDKNMVNKHLGGPIQVGTSTIDSGIIIPESQNFPLMDPSLKEVFDQPCDLQYSITGTWAMMIGFAAGLPPLWDIETGQSGVGVFALMDQGSNNGRGIIPAPPDAWTRIYAGWESPKEAINYKTISLESNEEGNIFKKQFSPNEYFLIENRNNWYRDNVNIDSTRYYVWQNTGTYPPYINILLDSTSVVKNQYGVITSVPNYNLGLPASGLLIWHIDENKIRQGIASFSINNEKDNRGIDLEEADGAQDIGYVSNLLTDPSAGYWGDMWFSENQEYFRANAKGSMVFSSHTFPNSKSKTGASSGIVISDISKANKSMTFNVLSNYEVITLGDVNKSIHFQWDIDKDGNLDFVGGGDILWWSNNASDFNKISNIDNNLIDILVAKDDSKTHLVSLEKLDEGYFIEWFEFDSNVKRFFSNWKKEISTSEEISLISADGDKYKLIIKIGKNFFSVDKEGSNKINKTIFPFRVSNNDSIVHLDDRIIINESITQFGQYRNISLIDFENDGNVDVLAVGVDGKIHAFNNNLYLKNGFPFDANTNNEVLALDLLGDESPELIFQDNSENIQILDNKGFIIDQIAVNNKLRGLGVYKGKAAIITDKNLILFKDYKKTENELQRNEWRYPLGSPDNSRLLFIEKQTVEKPFIMDFENTYAYPNPSFNENIIFRIGFGNVESIDINIFDIAGYSITSFPIDISNLSKSFVNTNSSNMKEVHWNTSNIDPGLYIARVIVRKGSYIQEKIIKVGLVK